MKPNSSFISRRGLSVMVVIASILMLSPVAGVTAEEAGSEALKSAAPAPAPVAAPAPVVPAAIPVADVTTQAAEVANILQKLTQKLAPSSEIELIAASLPDVSRQIEEELAATMKVLQRQPALTVLQEEQQQWQRRQSKNTEWLTVLTKRSNELQDALNRLTHLQELWAATLDASKASETPGPIIQQIDETAAALKDAQIPFKERIASVLDLQSRLVDEVAKCGTVLAGIEQVQKEAIGVGVFKRGPPVWSPALWADALTAMPGRVRGTVTSYWVDLGNYFKDPSRGMPLHAGLFVALVVIFLSARLQVRRWDDIAPVLRVFEHPLAASLTGALVVATSPWWRGVPGGIREVFQLAALAPMIILIRPDVGARLLPALYLLGLTLALGAVRRVFGAEILIEQVLLAIQSLLGIAVSIWILMSPDPPSKKAPASSGMGAKQAGATVALVILAAGLAAAVIGYVSLARQLIPGVLALGFFALELYTLVLVVSGLTAFALRVWPLRTLRMASHHRVMIERKIYRLLLLLAGGAFVIRYLGFIGLLEPARSLGKAVLSAKFERGAFSIAPGDVLEFILVVWVAYLLSAFIRFVLHEDIYPRMKIATGKSYAVSRLLHYFILALGFTAAIAALGVNLTKLTVLTGALGVGIGFGLQSVVNNFVSGLILLFERPVIVGDTVEVGDLTGRVQRIGIRASTVRTTQGADIIVPNSQLITEKVTNWTLSDRLRRIDLPVGMNYGAAPKEVIAVLEQVANAHPHVLNEPAPQGFFTGFGDSSMNFELKAWTDQFDDWFQIRSELATAVYDAVKAAGMSFPFPQREVRLVCDAVEGEDDKVRNTKGNEDG